MVNLLVVLMAIAVVIGLVSRDSQPLVYLGSIAVIGVLTLVIFSSITT